MNVSNRMPGDTAPLLIAEDIKKTLVALQEKDKKERITVCTDGSTNPKVMFVTQGPVSLLLIARIGRSGREV